jgi:hypothetical protein
VSTLTLAALPISVISQDLVLVSDVIDRPHVVCLQPRPGGDRVNELPPADCRRLADLVEHDQATVADEWVTVPWYGATTAHGHRILPSDAGLVQLVTTRSQVVGGAAA